MSSITDTRRRAAPALGTFERYLTVWVALCIVAGIVLGQLTTNKYFSYIPPWLTAIRISAVLQRRGSE
jgi:ACR3 family arsenite efflux pump ArsB